MKNKTIRRLVWFVILFLILFFFLGLLGNQAHAAGLVDETINSKNLFSKYSLDHYQLDFYVDESWDWLPWNWSDGIGKSVMYGLYAITNFIWTVSMYLSNATGYIIQEAYQLDFISDTADAIGKNIQLLAGVTSKGFSNEGFYVGFLLLFILIIGMYVAYVGLLKRESSKAIRAVINFLTVFILSASFIAYAPSYITKINDFSSDISASALSLGTKIVVPDSNSKGRDSVALIRDSLFSIQVEQPWLLLQFGDSDKETIGKERVEQLLSVDPNLNNGEDRETAVKTEINDQKNKNMTLTKTMNRLGTVVFLFLFNLGISIFIFLLTGIMIFSQILFIIFAMFLPISFLLAMLPTYEGMAKRAIEKLFNTIMMRAGITLVITTAFSISSMFYSLSGGYPFFMVAFLQIVTFAGIYFKLGDLMSLFKLQSSDSQQMGRRMMRKPQNYVTRKAKQIERKVGRVLTVGGLGAAVTQRKQTSGDSKSETRSNQSSNHSKKNQARSNQNPEGTTNFRTDMKRQKADETKRNSVNHKKGLVDSSQETNSKKNSHKQNIPQRNQLVPKQASESRVVPANKKRLTRPNISKRENVPIQVKNLSDNRLNTQKNQTTTNGSNEIEASKQTVARPTISTTDKDSNPNKPLINQRKLVVKDKKIRQTTQTKGGARNENSTSRSRQ
ncbi:FUSC family protein [Enterococcus casseliflavus]|uniref:FUSC family protein n=1 Tax=Enterococcus casseliflavus TaxID=37734 RepID=UPI0021B09181|nr:FUSC family protein [Enterococcus casseliflavus]